MTIKSPNARAVSQQAYKPLQENFNLAELPEGLINSIGEFLCERDLGALATTKKGFKVTDVKKNKENNANRALAKIVESTKYRNICSSILGPGKTPPDTRLSLVRNQDSAESSIENLDITRNIIHFAHTLVDELKRQFIDCSDFLDEIRKSIDLIKEEKISSSKKADKINKTIKEYLEKDPSVTPLKDRVKILSFLGKKLHVLLPCICEFTNLEVLNLAGNQLSSLPASFGNLNKLKILDLSRNQLSSLPAFDDSNQLEILNIAGNQLGPLTEFFCNLNQLKMVTF